MPLTTLAGRSRDEVRLVLASVVRRLTPDPGIDALAASAGVDPELTDAVLREIAARADVELGSETAQEKTRLYFDLLEEIARVTIGDREAKVAAELGDRGELHPSAYRLHIGEYFTTRAAGFGVRTSHVLGAWRHPDSVHHVIARRPVDGQESGVTLFTQHVAPKRSGDAFTLLVVTHRQGRELAVRAAWRVYHREIPQAANVPALGVLSAFCERYGHVIGVGPVHGRLLLNTPAFLTDQDGGYPLGLLDVVRDNDPTHLEGSMLTLTVAKPDPRLNPRPGQLEVEVVIGYIIDPTLYADDLALHNLQVNVDVFRANLRYDQSVAVHPLRFPDSSR